ncbi:hypothetical protein JMUB7523_26300 [Staphylococcus aureus]
MSESDYNSMMETLYLQQNPNNAEHLAQSIADLERGKTITKDIDVSVSYTHLTLPTILRV